MKKLSLIAVCTLLAFCSCNNNDKKTTGSSSKETTTASAGSGDLYFEFNADGKEIKVDADDISGTFTTIGGHPTFKIFAGKEGAPQVMLIIPKDMKGPSSTPSGSPNFDDNITQGSVSLIDFPEKGYTTNSFNTVYPEMAVPMPDAVVVTAIEDNGKDAKIITGNFSVKTFGTHSKNNTDTKDNDHIVKGKFRIRHEFTSMSGDRF